MKTTITAITAITAIILIASNTTSVYAEVPSWVKNNAGWWADGTISESEFISGIEFLIKDGIITVPTTTVLSQTSEGVPSWVKNNAGWWADGTISDGEFVNGIQHLISSGIISVSASESSVAESPVVSDDSELRMLQAQLDSCSEIKKAYDRLNCERSAKHLITAYEYKLISDSFQAGPIIYYWAGLDTEGSSFEITSSGQAMLYLRMLVENTGSNQNEALFCTGPAICNYDVTNGNADYRYSQMDFTNGQLVLKPGETKFFNFFFGPNIGGGGTTFEYDSGRDYYFRGSESFGSISIPLDLE